MTKKPDEIQATDRFPSPRETEGIVTAVCDFGACRHGDDRPDSVHVRSAKWGTEFFIALPSYEDVHICDGPLCHMNFGPGHLAANRNAA